MEIMNIEVSQDQVDTLIEFIETEYDYEEVRKLLKPSMPDNLKLKLKLLEDEREERLEHHRDEALLGMI
jgi:hypothetical protein